MISDFFTNRITLCVLTAFFAAETIKFIVEAFLTKDWSLRNFISSGGMPSSHTASVVSLAAAVGLTEGFNSPLFFCVRCVRFRGDDGCRGSTQRDRQTGKRDQQDPGADFRQ